VKAEPGNGKMTPLEMNNLITHLQQRLEVLERKCAGHLKTIEGLEAVAAAAESQVRYAQRVLP